MSCVQNRRKDLVHSAALDLHRDCLIRYDRKSGSLLSTDLGRIASQYYITHTTLREYNEHLKPTMGEIELLKIFCLADEFKYMVVRDEEKPELVRLSDKVPIPIKDHIDEPTAKINVLLQVRPLLHLA
jgi:pre-mRNA-splicing helicase BRR2